MLFMNKLVDFEGFSHVKEDVLRSFFTDAPVFTDYLIAGHNGVNLIWRTRLFPRVVSQLLYIKFYAVIGELPKPVKKGIVAIQLAAVDHFGHTRRILVNCGTKDFQAKAGTFAFVERDDVAGLTAADGTLRLRVRLCLDERVFAAVSQAAPSVRSRTFALADVCSRDESGVARSPDVTLVANDGAVFPANAFVLSLASDELDRRLCRHVVVSDRLVLDDLHAAAVDALLRVCYAQPDAAIDALDALPPAAAHYVPTHLRRSFEQKLLCRLDSANALELFLCARKAHLALLEAAAAHWIMQDDRLRNAVWTDARLSQDGRDDIFSTLAVRSHSSRIRLLGTLLHFDFDCGVSNYAALVGDASEGELTVTERQFATVRGRVAWLWRLRLSVVAADDGARSLKAGLMLLDGPCVFVSLHKAQIVLLGADSLRPALSVTIFGHKVVVSGQNNGLFQVGDAEPQTLRAAGVLSVGGSLIVRCRVSFCWPSIKFDCEPHTYVPMCGRATRRFLQLSATTRPWFLGSRLAVDSGFAVACARAVLQTRAPPLAARAVLFRDDVQVGNLIRYEISVVRELVSFLLLGQLSAFFVDMGDVEALAAAVVELAPTLVDAFQAILLDRLNAANAVRFYTATHGRPQLARLQQASGAAVIRASLEWSGPSGEQCVKLLRQRKGLLASLLAS